MMAYVGISKQLKLEVEQKIRKMKATELMSIQTPADVALSLTREVVEAHLWGDYMALKSQLPDNWKQEVRYLWVREYNDAGAQIYNGRVDHISITDGPPKYSDTIKLKASDNALVAEHAQAHAQ